MGFGYSRFDGKKSSVFSLHIIDMSFSTEEAFKIHQTGIDFHFAGLPICRMLLSYQIGNLAGHHFVLVRQNQLW